MIFWGRTLRLYRQGCDGTLGSLRRLRRLGNLDDSRVVGEPRHDRRRRTLELFVLGIARERDLLREPRGTHEEQGKQGRTDHGPLNDCPRRDGPEEEDDPPLGQFKEIVRMPRVSKESALKEARVR